MPRNQQSTLKALALAHECPTCGAPPTANCRKLPALDTEMDVSHPERVNLVRTRVDHRRVG